MLMVQNNLPYQPNYLQPLKYEKYIFLYFSDIVWKQVLFTQQEHLENLYISMRIL